MKDEYKKVQIPFGFNEKMEKVWLPLFHSFFVAMTGHGKTVGMKSLLYRFHDLHPDWKILIIDSKDKRDYADIHADISICFVETTEPLDLKNLLEPLVGAKMMYYFDSIIQEAVFDTLGEVQRSIAVKISDADSGRVRIHGKELGKLRVLNHLMGKLVLLIEKPNITKDLKLHDGFNVMPVSLPDVKNPNLKRAFQQLIVRSALILLLSDPALEKTLLVLDEVHKWSPQRYSSICKQPLSEYVSEGRSQDKILWESDQALTKVDKEPLKNIKIWIVGQQMEKNEVDDAKKTVNDITDLSITESDIKTLQIGRFVLIDGLHGKADRVYLQPYGVPDPIAQQIAAGANSELAESYIMEFESRSQENDEMYKEKAEQLEKKLGDLSRDHTQELEKTEKMHKEEIEKVKSEADLNGYSRGRAEAEDEVKEARASEEQRINELTETKDKLKRFEKFEDALAGLIQIKQPQQMATQPAQAQGQKITLDAQVTEITVQNLQPKEIKMTTDKPAGQILYCALALTKRLGSPFTATMLKAEALEKGWPLNAASMGATLMYMAREGILIKDGDSYRLPSQVKFSAVEPK